MILLNNTYENTYINTLTNNKYIRKHIYNIKLTIFKGRHAPKQFF